MGEARGHRYRRWRQGAHTALAAVVVVVAGGCGALETVADAPAELTFEYQHVGGEGSMDRTLTITNHTEDVLAADLSITGLDEDGEPLERLSIVTAMGSADGEMLLSPGSATDVLFVSGADIGRQADVAVTVEGIEVVDRPPAPSNVESEPLGATGEPVRNPSEATAVRLTNPSEHDLTARVIHIVFDLPPSGVAQQVQTFTEIAGPVDVPAGRSVVVRVSRNLHLAMRKIAYLPATMKAHVVHEDEEPRKTHPW